MAVCSILVTLDWKPDARLIVSSLLRQIPNKMKRTALTRLKLTPISPAISPRKSRMGRSSVDELIYSRRACR
jgi:hypothetical protein